MWTNCSSSKVPFQAEMVESGSMKFQPNSVAMEAESIREVSLHFRNQLILPQAKSNLVSWA